MYCRKLKVQDLRNLDNIYGIVCVKKLIGKGGWQGPNILGGFEEGGGTKL